MANNSIKKIAFFVEGATELIFIEKLLKEVLATDTYIIEKREMRGGSKKNIITINVLNTAVAKETTKCYILITDCGGDSTVKSYVLDQRASLIKSGYTLIVGLLDLFPKNKADLHKFQYGLYYQVPQKELPICFVISVMEVEAWFIAEKSHFLKVDNKLTVQWINSQLNIDLDNIVFEDIPKPAETLNSIYKLVGKGYSKKSKKVQITVDRLDYSELYFNLKNIVSSLNDLITIIDDNLLN